ncbi:MAG: hypothetical protein HFI06_01620 [Eubacterium sp.]|jgi:methyl-accepting chemotaxis protein|nr:hypothetical protein [Eubacterium sp.]
MRDLTHIANQVDKGANFQTNILALNTSVEASRAGSAGKGFSVVSGEVRNLAISAMQVITECIQSIKTLMDEISLASVQQSEMIVSVENRIKEVSKVIQTNAAAAEQSAVISTELSEQDRTLNQLIGQSRIQ